MDRPAEAEFEAFVIASGPSLFRTAWLLVTDYQHAEDLLQTVLARVAQRWGHLDGSPEAYARRALVNLATDRRRRLRARAPELPMIDNDGPGHPRAADDFEVVELRDALARVLQRLPRRQRAVLVLRYFVGMDEQETADLLEVGVGTVKSSGSRALARLRAELPEAYFHALVGRAS